MPRSLLVALWVSACQTSPSAPVPPEPATPVLAAVGSIVPAWRFLEVTGVVELDGRRADKDMKIGTASTIETGAGGHALVTLGPGSIFEVRETTRMTLGASERKNTSVELLAGELWSFFDGVADYEVVTAHAVAGVRGTVFYVNAQQDKETIVCACSGAVHVVSLDPRKPSDEEIVAETWEHIAVSFSRRGRRIKTKSMTTIPNPPSHPDARGEELLAFVPTK